MRTVDEYLKFAEECERLARELPKEHHDALLKIASAWRKVAEEARRDKGTAET